MIGKQDEQALERFFLALSQAMSDVALGELLAFYHVPCVFVSKEEKAAVAYLNFLTIKPTMYIANVNDDGFENNPYLDVVHEIAKNEGGKILEGSNKVTVKGYENGYYLEPTVIEVQTDQCRVNQEEIFGPVVTMMPFDTEAEVLQMATQLLKVYIWKTNWLKFYK